jgi:hypothetical protein
MDCDLSHDGWWITLAWTGAAIDRQAVAEFRKHGSEMVDPDSVTITMRRAE